MSKLSGSIKVNKNQFLSKAAKILLILALTFISIRPIFNVQAAGTYTITYKDANGTVLATASANAGDTVNLAAYPNGAIAWVDTGANMSIVDPSARGMAYINYNLASPAPATAQPFTMTMPARNVTLTAFYGDYNGQGNEPRLLQFYLDLNYHDINSGCDLAFAGQYINISTPVRFVVNLPGANFFDPITVTASNCADPARDGTVTSGLTIDKWVFDPSYTGVTTPTPDQLFDPTQMIYVGPEDYVEIYKVAVNQNLDWGTGEEFQTPDTSLPPVEGITSTVTFQIDNTVWSNGLDSGQTAVGIGGGFTYSFSGTDTNSGTVLAPGNYVDSTVLTGTTWGERYGENPVTGGGIVPTHIDIPGHIWWWTDQKGNVVTPNNIAANFAIPASLTYTLHYAIAPAPPVPIIVKFNTDSQVYNGQEWTVRGFAVTSIDGVPVNIPENAPAGSVSKVVDLQNGLWLVLAGRVADPDIDAVSGTLVGTYALTASPLDFTVYDGDPANGGQPARGYQVVVQPGGLTVTPALIDTGVPPVDPGGPDGGDGGAPGTPGTGSGSIDNAGANHSLLVISASSLLGVLIFGALVLAKNSKRTVSS